MAQIQIRGNKQIMDGSIENAQIADSTIELGKLARGGDILLKDGSVAMAADFDAGNYKVVNLKDPENDQDAVTKKYADDTYLAKSANLSDLTDVAAARDNLDVYSRGEIDEKLTGALDYEGVIDVGSADNNKVKLSDLGDSLKKGYFYKIKGDGYITNEDDSKELAVNNGDMVIVNQDVDDTTDTSVDPAVVLDKVDNTESADLLRESDISTDTDFTVDPDKLTTRGTIKDFVDNAIDEATPNVVYAEQPDVTDGSDTVTLQNEPTVIRGVYLNGIREVHYSVDGSDIKFEMPLISGDVVIVDYEY